MAEYEKPDCSIDCVLFTLVDGTLKVLLLPRQAEPFEGRDALVGGYVRLGEDETVDDTMRRVLRDKSGISDVYIEQLQTFGGARRDPRGWSISIVYFALVPWDMVEAVQSRTGRSFTVLEAAGLSGLPFDHDEIVAKALERLRGKITYTTVQTFLMGPDFTVGEYQDVYEAISGRKVNDATFRKKLLDIEFIREVGSRNGRLSSAGLGTRKAKTYEMAGQDVGVPRMLDRIL